MNEETLRNNIRQAIRLVKKKKLIVEQKVQHDEIKLRECVRRLINIEAKILEEGGTPDNDPTPHGNTGINVLEDLLKKIIPVLETDYKLLTTSTDQRESFRSHIINAVVGALTPVEANNSAQGGASTDEMQEEVDIDVVDDSEDSKFIDIDGSDQDKAAAEEDPRDNFGIEGADVTGRNMAYASFKKIESSVIDAYDLLSNAEDQDLFYDYLIANLKLYFDKFEKELDANVEEPTNQAYDTAKQTEPDNATADSELDFNL